MKVVDTSTINAIKAFMAGKRQVKADQLLQAIPALRDMAQGELEQAILDAGYKLHRD